MHERDKTPVANRQHTAGCKKQDLTPEIPLKYMKSRKTLATAMAYGLLFMFNEKRPKYHL